MKKISLVIACLMITSVAFSQEGENQETNIVGDYQSLDLPDVEFPLYQERTPDTGLPFSELHCVKYYNGFYYLFADAGMYIYDESSQVMMHVRYFDPNLWLYSSQPSIYFYTPVHDTRLPVLLFVEYVDDTNSTCCMYAIDNQNNITKAGSLGIPLIIPWSRDAAAQATIMNWLEKIEYDKDELRISFGTPYNEYFYSHEDTHLLQEILPLIQSDLEVYYTYKNKTLTEHGPGVLLRQSYGHLSYDSFYLYRYAIGKIDNEQHYAIAYFKGVTINTVHLHVDLFEDNRIIQCLSCPIHPQYLGEILIYNHRIAIFNFGNVPAQVNYTVENGRIIREKNNLE